MVEHADLVETACLRIAFGMITSLLILDPNPIPPRFFRVQNLTALGLVVICAFFFQQHEEVTYALMMFLLTLNALMCFAGSLIWHLDKSPGGKALNFFAAAGLGLSLFALGDPRLPASRSWQVSDNFASALVLGTAITSMLLGHSYLISPAMTIAPLRRLLIALFGALALRVTLACWGLYWWTAEHPLGNLEKETLLWLSARWALGILAPLVLGWMAWETARIRSTQSATGILYVVVVVTFLGELTSLLLLEKTGYPL